MMSDCANEREACAADALCTTVFEDQRAHPGPLGPLADYERVYFGALAEAWRASDPEHATRDDPARAMHALKICLAQHCADACSIKRDFSCVGAFDWPLTEPGTKDIRLWITDHASTAWPDWDVRYCVGLPCDDALGPKSHTITDSQGVAEVTLELGDWLTALGVDGFVVVDAGADYHPFMFPFLPGPIRSGFYDRLTVPSKLAIDTGRRSLGLTPDPGRMSIWVHPVDCKGDRTVGVTVEAWTVRELARGYEPCPDCAYIYSDDNGLADPTRSDLSGLGGVAFVGNVPPLDTLVIVRDTTSRYAVAAQRVIAVGGYVADFRLYPMSRRQLERLPEALR